MALLCICVGLEQFIAHYYSLAIHRLQTLCRTELPRGYRTTASTSLEPRSHCTCWRNLPESLISICFQTNSEKTKNTCVLNTEYIEYIECQADVTWSVCPAGVHNGEMDVSVSFCPLFCHDNLLSLGQSKKSQTSIKFNSLSTKLVPRQMSYTKYAVNIRAFMCSRNISLLILISFIGELCQRPLWSLQSISWPQGYF